MVFSRLTLFAFSVFSFISFTAVTHALPMADVGDGYICSRNRQVGSVHVTGFIGSTGRSSEVSFDAVVARGKILNGSYQQSSGATFNLIEVLNDRTIPSVHKRNLKKIRRYAACCENENGPLCPEPPMDPRIVITRASAPPAVQLSEDVASDNDLDRLFRRRRLHP